MSNDSIYTFMFIGCSSRYLRLATRDIFRVTCNKLVIGGTLGSHMKSGKLIQPALPKAERIPGELIIGWVVHYLIGITYSLILMLCVNQLLGATPYPTSQFTCCMGWHSSAIFYYDARHGSTSHFSLCTFTHI